MNPESKNRGLEMRTGRGARRRALRSSGVSLVERSYARSTKEDLAGEYRTALARYLENFNEQGLQEAYEVGRQAVASGLCVTEMHNIHHEALSRVLIPLLVPETEGKSLPLLSPHEHRRLVESADVFLDECLMPFEVTYSGYVEASEALRSSEERYRELFENANDIIFITDLLGNFISINRAGERMTGYTSSEARRMNIGELCAPECQEAAFRMLDHRVMGDAQDPCELELLAKDGQRIPVEVSCQLVCRDEKPFGIQAIARDITERKRARESLRHMTEALEQEAKRIAHALHDEAGQLLASVHIALETVARDLPVAEGHRVRGVAGLLDEIENQLRRLSHELRPTILDDLGLAPALEFLTHGISARTGVPIEVDADGVGRLFPQLEEVLYRVVQEALTNASKHARAAHITVTLRQGAGMLICRVSDDGIGFDMSAAKAAKDERGFGLITMKERIKFVGGTCEITSSPDHGTEVLVTVPLESDHAAQNLAG